MERTGRPAGIWIIVCLQIFNASIAIVDVITGSKLSGGELAQMTSGNELLRAAVLIWSGLVLTATISLFLLKRRGWALMMLLVGVSLLAHLVTWWNEPANTQWLSMGVVVLTAFYLNSAAVRQLFLRHHEVTRIALGGRSAL